MNASSREASLVGLLPVGVMLCVIVEEYTGSATVGTMANLLAVAMIACLVWRVRASGVAFTVIGLALLGWSAATRPDWMPTAMEAVQRGAMVVALFTALSAIRTAAMGSEAILECGRFLARQPPGRRYTALTIGGHLFGLILLYGAISLLGSLATESAAADPDQERRRHRVRRMLVAIQRGFAATLCWSPLGFSMAITIAIVPGASWSAVVLPCVVSALMMMAAGWALDTIFRPHVTPMPRAPETGRWLVRLRPLLLLLAVVITGVAALHLLTGVEVIGVVMSVVPVVAILWIALQPAPRGAGAMAHTGARIMQFVTQEIPAYRGEIVLLFMAGFIGTLGSLLLVPLVKAQGLDFGALPPLLIVVAMVWIVPLTGQLGMNPILAVSLLVPLLPSPAEMGVPPAALVAAITGGWALSGATSPFTASVLIAATLGRVTPREVGLRWNGLYTLVVGVLLSLWVLILALL
ncbi:hypothetical protein D2T29_03605 [Sinirhodobacter populi]|uniref:Citrate transporter n=1 Tax=Paenirhodobacter populi TaxID=2306993 RepID=A0A443KP43_9RHOB|nr:hypothetical protein [Sinirhodobacter populi]RWR34643.1 hypothetical protein D2T29_03605 [Sinirhodobacter populi]